MAHLIRHLIRGAFAAALLLVAPLRAEQETATPPATFTTLLVGESSRVVGGLFYDYQGKKIRVGVSSERLSRPYLAPPGSVVSLYREVAVPDEEKPRRVPVIDIPLGSAGRSLVLVNAVRADADDGFPQLRARVIDHSFAAHPRDAIRVFNFSRAELALRTADAAPFELSSGQQKVVPYPPENPEMPAVWLQAAMRKDDQWSVEISRPQSIVHGNTRTLWILTDAQGTLENPGATIALRSLVEPLPPPENSGLLARK